MLLDGLFLILIPQILRLIVMIPAESYAVVVIPPGRLVCPPDVMRTLELLGARTAWELAVPIPPPDKNAENGVGLFNELGYAFLLFGYNPTSTNLSLNLGHPVPSGGQDFSLPHYPRAFEHGQARY